MENTELNAVEAVENITEGVVETTTKKTNKALKYGIVSVLVAAAATVVGYFTVKKIRANKVEEIEVEASEENEAADAEEKK